MKTKLLKKIRKQYSIVYYPNGYKHDGCIFGKGKYLVYNIYWFRPTWLLPSYETKEKALDSLIRGVRQKYYKYSRKYNKNKYKGIKVWYNG